MATAKIPVREKGETTCIHHKGRQLEFYCKQCRDLVCPKCISLIHSDHQVCELSEIIPQKKRDIKDFIDRTKNNDLVKLRKYITSTDTALKDNDLDKFTAKTLSLYQRMKDDDTKLIQKYKQDLKMYNKQLKQQMKHCKTALQQGTHIEIYDTECKIDSKIHIPVIPVLGTVSFTLNKTLQCHLGLALGKIIISGQSHKTTGQCQPVSSSDHQQQLSSQQQLEDKGKKEVTRTKLLTEAKGVEEWKCPCNITSICPIDNDQAWTSDGFCETLTLLDRKGTVIQKVTHTTVINDISLSHTTHRLWACDEENNILELVSGHLTQHFTVKTFPYCICITAKNHVIVGITENVSKYTTQGQIILNTKAAGTGKPFVSSPWRITECPVTNNVAVIDRSYEYNGGNGNKCVVVMDSDFQELFVYRGDIPPIHKLTPPTKDKPFDPIGVVYDSQGNIIVSDFENHRILILSGGSEVLKILHRDVGTIGVSKDGLLWTKTWLKVKMLQYRM